MTLAPMLPCGQSPDAASINQISKRPFRAAPLLRRKFAAERRTAQGRLCRPEHCNAEGWSRLAGGGTQKRSTCKAGASFLAAGEGFEPSQTESESVVLPLHNPAIFRPCRRDECYYNKQFQIVKSIFKFFLRSAVLSL